VSRTDVANRLRHQAGLRTDKSVLRAARTLIARGLYPTGPRIAERLGRPTATVRSAIRRLRGRGLADWLVPGGGPRCGGKPRYSDELRALADELAEDGLGPHAVAREIHARTDLPVHEATIRKWQGRHDDPEAIARRAAEIRRGVTS
jgi:hypothetical protein